MKILYVASEAAPFIKVGGLGDVAGALPAALRGLGMDARVILPLYSAIGDAWRDKMTFVTHFEIQNSWRRQYCGVFYCDVEGTPYYFIDNEQYFKRANVYGEADDAERFAFFSRAVMEVLPHIDFFPDILHCNDWHTAFIPVLQSIEYYARPGYQTIKTVFSIHNIEFQGKFDPYILGNVFGLDESKKPVLFYGDCLNLMKGAIECANYVTTVSESYAAEILDPYFAFGLEHILQQRQFKLSGIINGIDTDKFNPATDPVIATRYDYKTRQLKLHNKRALQRELSLPDNTDVPLVGMIGRLTPQKGLDLIMARADELMQEPIQLVVLGTGYPQYEEFFRTLAERYPDKVRVLLTFSGPLAQKIYAGADMFLMPSKFEPCGLAQMIAMRYGTVPIVHAVGGLRDTVTPFDESTGTGQGVTFQSFNPDDMLGAVRRAVWLYYNKPLWRQLKANAMSGDYSWDRSARRYIELYQKL